jgi:hypothetical protein
VKPVYIERLPKCVSCGALLGRVDVSKECFDVQDAMAARCRDCAIEVLGIGVLKVGTLQHDCGGGRHVIRGTKYMT